jgi:hypothetical protein
LETKPIVTRWAIVGYEIPNTSETRPASKANFSRMHISRLGSHAHTIIFFKVPPAQVYLGKIFSLINGI